MAKVLLLFASREGQTRKVAACVANCLERAGASVQLTDAADSASLKAIELDAFDLLVFGASIHAGKLERELVDVINRNADTVEGQLRSFFVLSLSAAMKDGEERTASLDELRRNMSEQLAVTFDDVEMIAGALRYSKYPLPLKWFMRKIAASAGEKTQTSRDYEYTDWRQVKRYADRLSGLL